jgi:hypothetical protein
LNECVIDKLGSQIMNGRIMLTELLFLSSVQ